MELNEERKKKIAILVVTRRYRKIGVVDGVLDLPRWHTGRFRHLGRDQ